VLWDRIFRDDRYAVAELIPSNALPAIVGGITGALAAWLRDSYVSWLRRAQLRISGPVSHSDGTLQVWQMIVRNHRRDSARAYVAQFMRDHHPC
jgi:hypothetical protein